MKGQSLLEAVQAKPVLFPQDGGTSAKNSTTVYMAGYKNVAFLINVGAITGTIDAKVQRCTAADGTGATDITGAAITQIGATEDNRLVAIDVNLASANIPTTHPYLRVVVTPTGGSTNLISAVALRYNPDGVVPVTQDATMPELVQV